MYRDMRHIVLALAEIRFNKLLAMGVAILL